ncbi:ATP-dependent DNA helicase Pif1-like [Lampetra planeri]
MALSDFDNLPQLSEYPHLVLDSLLENNHIRRELEGYDRNELQDIVERADRLNTNQREIYDEIVGSVKDSQPDQKLFFIDGPGGTGKSTLLKHVPAKIRLQGKIAIAVASSGIASLQLPGGRTAHSTFKIPLKPTNIYTCFIRKQSKLKAFIKEASLIVWDKAPMTHRFAFEAVDHTLHDILDNLHEPFGGKVVVLSGDFRQILPVVKKKTPADTVDACFKSSDLWSHFKQVHLTVNMKVQCAENQESAAELAAFSEFLLEVGEGRHEVDPDLGPDCMKIPPAMVIDNPEYDPDIDGDEDGNHLPIPLGMKRIVDAMYSADELNYPTVATNDYFAHRTILTPTNAAVQRMNEAVADRLREAPQVYLSTDSVEDDERAGSAFFETDVLNSVNINGVPPHKLILNKGIAVMMMRNLNPDAGLCNGTRLRIVEMKPHVIRATIMTGTHNGKEVLIPQILFISDDDTKDFPFRLQRKQFPIVPAFAMTINKAQGQTVHNLALYLPTPCFSHGQLYVALSRVTARSNIKALIEGPDDEEEDGVYTKNIVCRQMFEFYI